MTVYICKFATSMGLIIIVISARIKPLQISCGQEERERENKPYKSNRSSCFHLTVAYIALLHLISLSRQSHDVNRIGLDLTLIVQ